MDLKLRCSASGCDCINFVAATTKDSLRVCDGCSHSWMTHLLEKLLTSRDDALSIFDVCSLALYGTHALPIRLKIVIERLLATLQPDEVDKILRSFGWTPQDLARGYMIQDPRGGLLARWSMPPREEEILILQQFLRFQATRALSFALLRDDFPLMSPATGVSHISNNFTSMFHPSMMNLATSNQQTNNSNNNNNNNNSLHSNNNNNNNNNNNISSSSASSNNSLLSPKSPANHNNNNNNNSLTGLTPGSLFSLNNSHLNLGVPHFLSNTSSLNSSTHNPAVTSANHNNNNNTNNHINNSSNNTSSNVRNHLHQNDRHGGSGGGSSTVGGGPLPISLTSSSGDRSRSRSGRRSTNSSALNLSVQSESEDEESHSGELNLSTNNHSDNNGRKPSMLMNEVVDLSSSASASLMNSNNKNGKRGIQNNNNEAGQQGGLMSSLSQGLMVNHHHHHLNQNSKGSGGGDMTENQNHLPRGEHHQHHRSNQQLAMSNELINNLNNMHKSVDLMAAAAAAAAAAASIPQNNGPPSSAPPSLGLHSRKSVQPLKRGWNPIPISAQLVAPASGMTAQGKRRVQCSVCLKTFCDKGALKIHFSAVHLREMHACTISGCKMMFSSRRSRNRHSANPNPKLHSPHLRRKISPHDGRSSQPLLNLNNPMLFPGSQMRFPPFLPGLGLSSQNGGMGIPSESGKEDKSSDDDMMMDMKNQVKMNRMMDPDGSNSEASFSSANEEFLEPKSPPSNSSSKKDGARKRKLTNPVRLSSVADDSNDEFCCYDDGTVVSHEDDDIEENDEMEKFKEDSINGTKKEGGSRGSSSDVQSPLGLTGQHGMHGSSPNNDFNEEKFLTMKSDVVDIHPSMIKMEKGISEEKESFRRNFRKDDRHERNSREISDNDNHNEEEKTNENCNNKSEKSSEDEEADHLGKLEALPIFSSPHNSDSSMKSEDEENNRSTGSPNSNGEIPMDPIDPKRCVACQKVFQNHFGVKTHYQNVHLKVMHKCTVDSCQAAFPSKRSRDRHAANLNLHRKLLSTSDNSNGSSTDSLKDIGMRLTPGVSPAGETGGPNLIFNPYLFQNGSAAGGPSVLGLPTQTMSPPMANPPPWNPFLPFHMFPTVFGTPPPGIPKETPVIVDCRFCKKSFEDGASIRNHMDTAHSDEVFRCRCCSSVFYSRKKFESHSKACVE